MELAEKTAKLSPCTRRKYGAVIATNEYLLSEGYNYRVGRCCEGNICVRDRAKAPHGGGIEVGAEIHAEAIALLDNYEDFHYDTVMYLAGYDKKGELLTGIDSWPCHYCAMLIKYKGIRYMVIRAASFGDLMLVSIDTILHEQELLYEETYA